MISNISPKKTTARTIFIGRRGQIEYNVREEKDGGFERSGIRA
jgi:hypothetical protein